MYSVLNTLSEYTYFYISKNIISYTFLLVFKIVESLQCILRLGRIMIHISTNTKTNNYSFLKGKYLRRVSGNYKPGWQLQVLAPNIYYQRNPSHSRTLDIYPLP